MKYSIALTLATAGSFVAAQHHHQHRHPHKRDADTVIKYVLDGNAISASDVCAGIKKGSLEYKPGEPTPAVDPCQESTAATSSAASSSTLSVDAAAEFAEVSASVAPATSSAASTPAPSSGSSSGSSGSSGSSSGTGMDRDFPDGEIDCGSFPSDYGAIALDYLDLGGWSGIQYVTFADELISDIVTAVTGDDCHNGAMCSYACPPGYQKSQWPTTQGSTGQSVGGLQCKGGKLYLTNKKLSSKLCIEGVGGVHVQNNLGEEVAVCRTDYPGTESETIPLTLGDNDLQPLTCPDANYFKWEQKVTSAQYYVNPKGTPAKKGCQWGDGSEPIGNWAPINLGVGENNGKWLSISQNAPTTNEKLDFNIKIKGSDLGGSCKYEDGSFISDTGSNDSGCTVKVNSGDATFVFY
ncbi:SUN-domain-containing protein [Aspergillus steynii IBT 23096]|uniref:SUN-domain-containing protein n=1 Tax=Aspergillus steynii IBT 23096 TaxID=1392250 RepID=A0A2I2FZK5_9EURO|nr:SUN-domain-containing protein [Aspergillus steynii IBT 23096]PLB46054.1 SUN-domain-containing protein [Aspergillus steynii IBT 23096]